MPDPDPRAVPPASSDDAPDAEIPLPGGDVTEGVVRVGDTVRRPLGRHSPTVHRMLTHLGDVGFDGAPRLLGLDDLGREVLTFIDGEVAGRPWPAWVADPERAASVARLLRRLDDAMLPLGLPAGLDPDPIEAEHLRPDEPPATFLGHRDVTPENTVFRDEVAHALIDFDFARPTNRVLEVANLLRWWAGWCAPQDRDPVFATVDPGTRARLLVDAYGLGRDDRRVLVSASIHQSERGRVQLRARAERYGGGWARMWNEGAGEAMIRRSGWLHEHADRLTQRLLA